jgi:hypothetical protein
MKGCKQPEIKIEELPVANEKQKRLRERWMN